MARQLLIVALVLLGVGVNAVNYLSAGDMFTRPIADCTPTFCTMNAATDGPFAPWEVTAGNIDHIVDEFWEDVNGDYSVDMDGTSAATIQTSVLLPNNEPVVVAFCMAGNPEGGNPTKNIELTFESGNTLDTSTFSFSTVGRSRPDNMGWERRSMISDADNTFPSTVRFRSLSPSGPGVAFGPTVDDVIITPFNQFTTTCSAESRSTCLNFENCELCGGSCQDRCERCDIENECDVDSDCDNVFLTNSLCFQGATCEGGFCCPHYVQCLTTDACRPAFCNDATGTCEESALFCDDSNDCTEDFCSNGNCHHVCIQDCCSTDDDCNDGDVCTRDRCYNKQCRHHLIPGCTA